MCFCAFFEWLSCRSRPNDPPPYDHSEDISDFDELSDEESDD